MVGLCAAEGGGEEAGLMWGWIGVGVCMNRGSEFAIPLASYVERAAVKVVIHSQAVSEWQPLQLLLGSSLT